MKLIIVRLFLLLTGLGPQVLFAQQFMLPPPTRQLTEPPGYNLFVVQMAEDRRGRLWLTTDDGLTYMEGPHLRTLHDPRQPTGDRYRQLAVALDGRIWMRQSRVGLRSRLAYIDPDQQKIMTLPDTARLVRKFLGKYDFDRLYIDHREQLWISLPDHGLLRVNPVTLAAEHIVSQPITVQALAEGPDGRMWLGTTTGLYGFDPQTGKQQHFLQDSRQANTPGSDEITAIRVRSNGDVVIGLYNEVAILTPKTGQVRRVRLPLPVPTSRMWTTAFLSDRAGNDYFSVGLMVCRLTPAGTLQRLEFARPVEKVISIFVSQGQGAAPDQLWVNAAHRLDQYDLSHLRPLPAFNILDVEVNGTRLVENEHMLEERFQRDTTGQATLTVREGDFVQFRFTAYAHLNESRFRYKLADYDQQWATFSDQIGTGTYQPPAGEHTFLFNRAGRRGWETKMASLRIRVRPVFWKTAWFIALVLTALAGVVFWLNRAASRRQKLRRELARQEGEATSLRQLDEFKTQFFANVTHELRTPLTIILNAAEQLEHSVLNQQQQHNLASVQRNAHQLLRLVNETLDMAKLDAGKLEPSTQLGDPLLFVGQIVGQFSGLAGQKGIDLQGIAGAQPADPDRPAYYFDDSKLEKIVYNLLANAIKFTPAGGSVRVEGQVTEASLLRVRVTDTGIGIPADELGRIFERFYQHSADAVAGSSVRAYSGTGIGLAFVRELTEWLGGHVSVTSEPGTGSVFTIELPLTRSADTSVLASPARWQPLVERPIPSDGTGTGPAGDAHPSLVLVVEDNAELRSYVANSLSAQYRIITAENGRLGLDLAIQEVPDLIVSDVMMPVQAGPELDGYELVERLKTDERTSHIPVILLTARSSQDSRLKGLGAGADDYLGKPFSLAELTLRVGNCLQTRRNWQQWLTGQSAVPERRDTPAEPVVYPDKEERFLTRLRQQILDHLDHESLDVDWLATQAGMSRTQLHRKLTALTTLSPNRFIHQVRVRKAAELLQTGNVNVAQAAYQVGYSSPSHFSRVFQEHMGYPPARLKV